MKHSSPLDHLRAALADLEGRGLLRTTPRPDDPDAPSFCSNDYLGLAATPAPALPAGAGASRLVAGEHAAHGALEQAIATFLDVDAALLFTSGYAANVGVLSALVEPHDLVVSDVLNHASLIDGIRLARATPVVVPHLDVDAVARALHERVAGRRAWVVVESYYSMDADAPDLRRLRALCDAYGAALVVDEAHAIGILGPGGRGLSAAAGVHPDVVVGTLGKALGSQGAFVAGRSELRAWLWNRARSFVFSTGLSPAAAAAAHRALQTVIREPERASRVLALAAVLRDGIVGAGAERVAAASEGDPSRPRVLGDGHVVPIVVGTEARALALAEALTRAGVAVRAIRPPTVPPGTARVRLTVTARHSPSDIERAVAAVRDAFHALA